MLLELHEVHPFVFERMVKSLDGKQVVAPLSGGCDYRLIVDMLSRFNHHNVLCVSWGKEYFWEVQVVENAAHSLVMDWVRVENSRSQRLDWYNAGKFHISLELCGALTTVPYIQDNILIGEDVKSDPVNSDAIFISRNSGILLRGST